MGMGDYMTTDKNGNAVWVLAKSTIHAVKDRPHHSRKRYRASVVVIQDGKLLLVRDTGKYDFSLPGGGFKHGETTIQAGIREAFNEELGGVKVISAERLPKHWDVSGERAYHKFVRLNIQGEPYIKQSKEIDKVIWWDMKSPLPVQGHVKYIVSKIRVQK